MYEVITIITLLSSYLYYSVTYILGLNLGSVSESFFSKVIISVFFISIFYSFLRVFMQRKIIVTRQLLGVLFFYTLNFIYFSLDNNVSEFKLISMIYLLPSVLLSLCAPKFIDMLKVKKILIYCMYLFTASTSLFLYNFFINGHVILRQGFGSGTYQNAGYSAAFAFAITLFLYDSKKLLKLALLILQFVACIVSTASGPFFACIVVIMIYAFSYIKKNNLINFKNFVRISLLLGALVIFVWIVQNTALIESLEIVVSFFSLDTGIDVSATGRSEIYNRAISLIVQNLFGYGVYNYYGYIVYPHNIILEFMLQGGVIFTFIGVVILYYLNKYYVFSKIDFYVTFRPLFLVTMIMLLVSGSYMFNSIFWYCLLMYLKRYFREY